MTRKLYEVQESGGIAFVSERRPGDVRIPNYVYDIWMPLLGVEVIGVYAVYCRLEMAGEVKKMTQTKLASACRMGTRRLSTINDTLQDCGFITMYKPQGVDRLKHFTTRILVKDPPREVSPALIERYYGREKSEYEALATWLVECQVTTPEMSNDNAGDVKRHHDVMSNDNAKIESLGLQPVIFESSSSEADDDEKRPNIFTLYEDTFGPLTAILSDELKALEEEYPAAWLEDAFKAAALNGARGLAYVKTTLSRWRQDGKNAPSTPAPATPKPTGAAAHQGTPVTTPLQIPKPFVLEDKK